MSVVKLYNVIILKKILQQNSQFEFSDLMKQVFFQNIRSTFFNEDNWTKLVISFT